MHSEVAFLLAMKNNFTKRKIEGVFFGGDSENFLENLLTKARETSIICTRTVCTRTSVRK